MWRDDCMPDMRKTSHVKEAFRDGGYPFDFRHAKDPKDHGRDLTCHVIREARKAKGR